MFMKMIIPSQPIKQIKYDYNVRWLFKLFIIKSFKHVKMDYYNESQMSIY